MQSAERIFQPVRLAHHRGFAFPRAAGFALLAWAAMAPRGAEAGAWSTYLGGADADIAYAVAVDPTGNVYAAGETSSADWLAGGAFAAGESRAFVVKLAPNGALVWLTYLGGGVGDVALGVAADATGAYVTGATFAAGWTAGGYDSEYGGGGDGFVVKLAPGGAISWSSYLGGPGYDAGRAIGLDALGDVFVTGGTFSDGWTSGTALTAHMGAGDAFVVKLAPDGQRLWSTDFGGAGPDEAHGVAIDDAGEAFVCGFTYSPGWAAGGGQTTFAGVEDAFVAKISVAGTIVWSTYLGGALDDYAFAVATDGADAYVTGYTTSSGWASGGFKTSPPGAAGMVDAFVARVGAAGQLKWSTYAGGPLFDDALAIAVERGGDVFIAGYSNSMGWLRGGEDIERDTQAFIIRLAPAGTLTGSVALGGEGDELGFGLAVDNAGYLYLAGYTDSPGWMIGGAQTVFGGGVDGFAIKMPTMDVFLPPPPPATSGKNGVRAWMRFGR